MRFRGLGNHASGWVCEIPDLNQGKTLTAWRGPQGGVREKSGVKYDETGAIQVQERGRRGRKDLGVSADILGQQDMEEITMDVLDADAGFMMDPVHRILVVCEFLVQEIPGGCADEEHQQGQSCEDPL